VSREKLVEDCLDLEDEIQKSFEARLDGAYGIIFMSKRKLLFITEKGRFRKRYDLVLDLPYEKIKSLRTERDYTLIVEDIGGLKHAFRSVMRGQIVEKALVELMSKEPS
jgi:hypothetical protein